MSDYSLPNEYPNTNQTNYLTQNFQFMPEDQNNLTQGQILPKPSTMDTSKLEEIRNQSQTIKTPNKPKTTALMDIVKRKKGLYARIKIAYHKKIDQDIDNGKKGLLDMDKFVFELIEEGLNKVNN